MSSISFENSHQRVGLNRVGKYYKTVPEKGPGSAGVSPASWAGGTPAPHNQPWRRWTGIVGSDANRLTWKQRRRGIRRLLKQIEMRIVAPRKASNSATPKCGVFDTWGGDLDGWACAKSAGRTLESICVEFGISKAQLNALTREYNSLSAQEMLDGFKLRRLKSFLLERIKATAFDLWGRPGYFAMQKIEGYVSCSEKCPRDGMTIKVGSRKQPKFFRLKPEDLIGEQKWAEKARRTAQLVHKMWDGFDLEGWASAAGYSSAARLKRAVISVMGKTLDKLEEALAGEIVEFYQCAEDFELRKLACSEREFAEIFRAREFYHGCEDKPCEPFLDMWSAYEAGKPQWLARMAAEFG